MGEEALPIWPFWVLLAAQVAKTLYVTFLLQCFRRFYNDDPEIYDEDLLARVVGRGVPLKRRERAATWRTCGNQGEPLLINKER